eukprot:5821880-Karenia_brevis.AAC.1
MACRAPEKLLVMITMFANSFTQSAGHMAELIDPGINGSLCTDQWRRDVAMTIDCVDPTLTLFHVPYENDDIPHTSNVTTVVDQMIACGMP